MARIEASVDFLALKSTLHAAFSEFIRLHNLRLVILPIYGRSSNQAKDASRLSFPDLDFSERMGAYACDHLFRSRSFYLTHFNRERGVNKFSPFQLQKPPSDYGSDVENLASSFSEMDFSGLWMSLHTHPYSVNDQEIIRSTLICWTLVELWTNNERNLRALWVHPSLSATGTTLLLQGFLPYLIFEALTLPAEESSKSESFFSVWNYVLAMLPRCCVVLLLADEFVGLPQHFDAIGENGHTDDGNPPGQNCACNSRRNEKKIELHRRLSGASIKYFNSHFSILHGMIPKKCSLRLKEDVNSIPFDMFSYPSTLPSETLEEVKAAEFASLPARRIKEILFQWYDRRGQRFLKDTFK
ncbi:hypothetical protein IE077_003682 [Cardiosporidium cionae]|uniref:Uncharacterized protein n=1 Tax=Cardiosporidium cionae TaxID=476202 RepID=A0ABQ7J409_9APIC|nr:hypothetical protein IE077_003682 [Cardiosporidium cionae]|eukprot:KAF8817842.1 hypothetical protein IE077_003682 [Cardiosporidium cionae]